VRCRSPGNEARHVIAPLSCYAVLDPYYARALRVQPTMLSPIGGPSTRGAGPDLVNGRAPLHPPAPQPETPRKERVGPRAGARRRPRCRPPQRRQPARRSPRLTATRATTSRWLLLRRRPDHCYAHSFRCSRSCSSASPTVRGSPPASTASAARDPAQAHKTLLAECQPIRVRSRHAGAGR
jgi:hypothetical protein